MIYQYEKACEEAGMDKESIAELRRMFDADKKKLKRLNQRLEDEEDQLTILHISDYESEDSDVEGLELEDPNADVENNTINEMLLDQLKEYLADLDEADRIFILTLFSFKNKQVTRTSEIYGCTERITAYRRDRIIEKLQAKFFGKFYGNN